MKLEGDLATCRSCGAAVVFCQPARGGFHPPYNLDGVSHFATCPQAKEWRGKAKR